MSIAFISYSRKDKDFVVRLNQALTEQKVDTWVDWEGIPPTTEWLQEIFKAIEATDTFIVVISSDALVSEVCRLEIEHALKHSKRLVLVLRQDIKNQDLPADLSKYQWIPFRDCDDFDFSFQLLITAINTDLDYVRTHTRLLVKSLEWERNGLDRSFLLRGRDLKDAEVWLVTSGQKEPKPTDLQGYYIHRSRQAVTLFQRIILGAVTFGLIVSLFLALISLYQYKLASLRGRLALARQLSAQSRNLLNVQYDLALLLSVEANQIVENLAKENYWAVVCLKVVSLLNNETFDINEARSSLLEALTQKTPRLAIMGKSGDFIRDISFSPDWSSLVVLSGESSKSKYITFWDVSTAQMIGSPLLVPDSEFILGFSNDGRTLVTFNTSNDLETLHEPQTLITWDVATRSKTGKTPISYLNCNDIVLSPQGDIVATVEKHRITLFTFGLRKRLANIECPMEIEYRTLTFSGDGKTLAVSLADSTIMVWDISRPQKPRHICREVIVIDGKLSLSHDGKLLFFRRDYAHNDDIVIWSLSKRQEIGRITMPDDFHYNYSSPNIALSPNGQTLFLWSGECGEILSWNLVNRGIQGVPISFFTREKLIVSQAGVKKITFSPNGKILASADWSGHIILWDLSRQQRMGKSLKIPGVDCATYDPKGEFLALGRGQRLEVWSVRELYTPNYRPKVFPHPTGINKVSFSPDGKLLSTITDKTISLWDLASGQRRGQPLEISRALELAARNTWDSRWDRVAITWESNERLLAAVSWERKSQNKPLNGNNEKNDSVDHVISLWDVENQCLIGEPLKGHLARVSCLTFSPDSQILASGDQAGTIRFWNMATGCPSPMILKDRGDMVNNIVFQRDCSILASGHVNGWILFWDLVNGKLLGPTINYHRAPVVNMAIHPNNLIMASFSTNNILYLWDILPNIPLGKLPLDDKGLRPHSKDENYSLLFSPNGKELLLAGNYLQSQILWDVDFNSWKTRACRIANRNMTSNEWKQYLGKEAYRPTCPNVPASN